MTVPIFGSVVSASYLNRAKIIHLYLASYVKWLPTSANTNCWYVIIIVIAMVPQIRSVMFIASLQFSLADNMFTIKLIIVTLLFKDQAFTSSWPNMALPEWVVDASNCEKLWMDPILWVDTTTISYWAVS